MKKKTNSSPSDPGELINNYLGNKKAEAFKVSDAYFDELPSRIRDSITASNGKSVEYKWFPAALASKLVLIPALSIVILLVAIYFSIPSDKSSGISQIEVTDTSGVSLASDASYMQDVVTDEYTTIYKLMESAESISSNSVSFSSVSSDEISDDDIINYLEEQDLDTDVLAEL